MESLVEPAYRRHWRIAYEHSTMTCQRRLIPLASDIIWWVVAVPGFLAVVVDLDGTIVSDRAVSPETVCAAADLAANGIPLIAATARTPAGVATLDVLTPHLTAAVCCGGALGWCPSTGRVLWRHVIAADRVKRLVEFVMKRIAGAGIAAHDGRQWRITQGFAALRGSSRSGVVQIVAAPDIGRHRACTMAICHEALSSDELAEILTATDFDLPETISYSAAGMIEIGPAHVDKGTGTRQVLDLLGVPASQVVAFGDMPNDLPVFALCGVSVAMGNAHPAVRAAATSVCTCVHDDGVARALHEFEMTCGGMLREPRTAIRDDVRVPGTAEVDPSRPTPYGDPRSGRLVSGSYTQATSAIRSRAFFSPVRARLHSRQYAASSRCRTGGSGAFVSGSGPASQGLVTGHRYDQLPHDQ